jgi:hypothetical protein
LSGDNDYIKYDDNVYGGQTMEFPLLVPQTELPICVNPAEYEHREYADKTEIYIRILQTEGLPVPIRFYFPGLGQTLPSVMSGYEKEP